MRFANTRALADEDSYEFVVPDNSSVSTVEVPAVASALAAGNPAAFRLKAPPPKRRVVATSRAARSSSLADQAPAGGGDETQARDVFQLSPTSTDVVAPSVEALAFGQSLGARRGLRSSAMQVVEIASAIAGAAMTRVLDNTGDVSWELDQMPRDSVHPGGATSSPSSAA